LISWFSCLIRVGAKLCRTSGSPFHSCVYAEECLIAFL